MNVQVVFVGAPFDRAAVIHTLRHLAMRYGWTLCDDAPHRIVYATTDDPFEITARAGDVVVLASRAVGAHLTESRAPLPLDANHLPFPHPRGDARFISADVIAGAHATMNLWYEQRARDPNRDGWITWRADWMARAGFAAPAPLADRWLAEIVRAAERAGWGDFKPRAWHNAPWGVVLTHDVDYLPAPRDFGLPRFARALARQLVLRHRPRDVFALLARFARTWRAHPYDTFASVMRAEAARGARSSFHLVPAHRHRFDPAYAQSIERLAPRVRPIATSEWEIALHASYTASRAADQIRAERESLERVIGAPVRGQRQHYLNFHPRGLFDAVARAGLQYDSSVGYNDQSGARAGTFFPYRPFDPARGRGYAFWEIPFVLMDTTLATTDRLTPRAAFEHSKKILSQVADARGWVAIIWHLEQLSGLIDPGFEQVYWNLLDWIHSQGGAMISGAQIVDELTTRWNETMQND